jgi:hypothetical protein
MYPSLGLADLHYPVAIVQDRYYGDFSGGAWWAIALCDTPFFDVDFDPTRIGFCIDNGPNGAREEARLFWLNAPDWIAAGNTPHAAVKALMEKRHADEPVRRRKSLR